MTARLSLVWERLRSSYWFVPSAMALVAVVLSFGLVRLDEYYLEEVQQDLRWIYAGGAEGARSVLATIAGSVITVAGTTFSITIAALSLASAQFGPRVLRSFMRDTGNQIVLGTFIATFLYCLLVLRSIRGLDDSTYVPHIAVSVGVALAVVSVGVLIYFIHHVAESIQVSYLIDAVAEELNDTIVRLFPEELGEPSRLRPVGEPDLTVAICATRDGYVQMIDEHGLMVAAREADTVVVLLARPGDYVRADQPVALVTSDVGDRQRSRIADSVAVGRVRTPSQDAEFAFLQLAEIAVRALSKGINDPFTAMMCLDRITSGMIRLTKRSFPDAVRRDDQGNVRVIAKTYTYSDLAFAAYGYIRENATEHPPVLDHLRKQIRSVINAAESPAMRSALEAEISAIR